MNDSIICKQWQFFALGSISPQDPMQALWPKLGSPVQDFFLKTFEIYLMTLSYCRLTIPLNKTRIKRAAIYKYVITPNCEIYPPRWAFLFRIFCLVNTFKI